MSSFTPFIPSDVFNPNLISIDDESLSLSIADQRYIRIGGNAYVSNVFADTVDADAYTLSGQALDLSIISGITDGIVNANKAVIVDLSNNITGFNNITSTGQMVCGQLNVGGYLSTVNGNQLNKLDTTADGVVYANKCMITDANSDIGTVRRMKCQTVMVGNDFSDTNRMITCLDSSVVAGDVRYLLTGGQANSTNNSAELSYYHSSNGSSNNEFRIGYNGGVLARFKFDGTWMNGAGTSLFNSSGQLTANLASTSTVDVSTRIVERHPDGMQIYNSNYNDTEFRLYCTSYNAYCGTWGNGALRLITGGTTMAYFGGIGSQNISFHGTSTSFPVSIQKNDGISSSSYGYINSGGNTGTTSNSSNISLYTSGRILCTGECDCISDFRVKKNICDVKQKFVDRFIDKVNPKCFIYKNESALSYGYIAQECIKAGLSRFVQMHENKELEEVIDEDGFVSPAGQEFSINSAYFIPLLHIKVKQLSDENKILKNDIEDMKNCIDEQADMIHELIARSEATACSLRNQIETLEKKNQELQNRQEQMEFDLNKERELVSSLSNNISKLINCLTPAKRRQYELS